MYELAIGFSGSWCGTGWVLFPPIVFHLLKVNYNSHAICSGVRDVMLDLNILLCYLCWVYVCFLLISKAPA